MIRTALTTYFRCLKARKLCLPRCLRLYLVRSDELLRYSFNLFIADVPPEKAMSKAIKHKNVDLQIETECVLSPKPITPVADVRKRITTTLICLKIAYPATSRLMTDYLKEQPRVKYSFDLKFAGADTEEASFFAAKYENLELIEELLKTGVYITARRIVYFAGQFGSPFLMQYFADNKINYSTMMQSLIRHNQLHIISRWYRNGTLDLEDVTSTTCYEGNYHVFNLLKHHRETEFDFDYFGVLGASGNPNFRIFKSLLKRGKVENGVAVAAYQGLKQFVDYTYYKCGASLNQIVINACNGGKFEVLDGFDLDKIDWNGILAIIIKNTPVTESFYTEHILKKICHAAVIDCEYIYKIAKSRGNRDFINEMTNLYLIKANWLLK